MAEGNRATEQNTFIFWIKMGRKLCHFALQKTFGSFYSVSCFLGAFLHLLEPPSSPAALRQDCGAALETTPC